MPITRTLVSAGAPGLDAQTYRWYSSVACSKVIFPAVEVLRSRNPLDNSNTFKKLQRWGLNGRLVVLFVGIISHSFGVGTAVKHHAAEHQHQLSFSQSGVQQLSVLRTRQVPIEPHFENGGIQPNAAVTADVQEMSPLNNLRSSQGIVSDFRQHVVSRREKVSLLSQREQERSHAAVESTDAPQASATSSIQAQPSAGTAGGVDIPLPSQPPGNTVALQYATVTATPPPAHVTTLLAAPSLIPLPSPAVSASSLSTPTARVALAGSESVLSGATLLPGPAIPSAVVAAPAAGTVPGGTTILPLQTGGGTLPVVPLSQPTIAGQPTLTAPDSAANATALPSASAVLLPSPSPVTQLAAVPVTTSPSVGGLQAPSAVSGVPLSLPAASPPSPFAPSSATEGLVQPPAGGPAPLTTTSAAPLAAAPPSGTPTAAHPLPESIATESTEATPEKEKTGLQTTAAGGTVSVQAAGGSDQGGGTCANDCTCVPVAVTSLLIFVICLIALLVEIILMGNLFSKGCMSKSFMRGGGWIILLAAALGLIPGLLIGGLVSSCWTMALFAGGGFMDFAVSIVLVGTRGAWLGALGGAVSAATVAALISPTALPLSLGGVAGLLGGIVIGFVPILTGLEINVRYIRFRMRTSRGGTTARPRSGSRGGMSYAPLHPKRDSTLPRDPRRSIGGAVEGMGGGLRSSVQQSATSPVESSDEATATADELASRSRL